MTNVFCGFCLMIALMAQGISAETCPDIAEMSSTKNFEHWGLIAYEPAIPLVLWSAPFNEVQFKSCHNTYDPAHAVSLGQALDASCLNIEIDVVKLDDGNYTPGDGRVFGVAHGGGDNRNNCGHDRYGGNRDLGECLLDLMRWHELNPRHLPITVNLDFKDGWDPDRDFTSWELDELILRIVPRSLISTPSDLKGAFVSARQAAQQGSWPTMSEMGGKFVFVMNGGAPLFNHNRSMNRYVQNMGDGAVLFVGVDTDESSDWLGVPDQFYDSNKAWVVFYNLGPGNAHLAGDIRMRGYMCRYWGDTEAPFEHFVPLYGRMNYHRFDGYGDYLVSGWKPGPNFWAIDDVFLDEARGCALTGYVTGEEICGIGVTAKGDYKCR